MGRAEAPTTFLFAGGGSGGHIYPGIAIAEQLLALSPAGGGNTPRIAFLASDRAIDRQVLEKFPYPFTASPAKPLSVRPRGLIRFLANWGRAVREAREVIRSAGDARRTEQPTPQPPPSGRGSVHLVAMGGFVAAPAVQAARVERIPITMVNLDAVPGKANRWMAKRLRSSDQIFTAARLAPHCAMKGWNEVPPIVRSGSRATITQAEARTRLGLAPDRPVLMVTGGSQGIRTINGFALAFAESETGAKVLHDGSWQILHQTGRGDETHVVERYQTAGATALVQPFVDHMNLWYAAADLVLGTAGAGNVAEIWANSVPALLMPYPYHKDQHQKFNALAIEQSGGAIIARDHIDPATNLREVGPRLTQLLSDAAKRGAMRRALGTLGPADGAERIARALLRA